MLLSTLVRRVGLVAVLALAALVPTASAAAPRPAVSGLRLDLLRPNIVVTSPALGKYTITNTGPLPTGSFYVSIHRPGAKAIPTFLQSSLAYGQSVTRSIGSDCSGTLPPPSFVVVADLYGQVVERSELDNWTLVSPTRLC